MLKEASPLLKKELMDLLKSRGLNYKSLIRLYTLPDNIDNFVSSGLVSYIINDFKTKKITEKLRKLG